MNPKLKKAFFYGGIVIAANIVLIACLVGVSLYTDHLRDQSVGEDTTVLNQVYAGTATRHGVIVKRAENHGNGVTVTHLLVQVLAKQPSKDGKHLLMVVGYRNLRSELATKIENKEVDVTKVADAGRIQV